ncbi:MAG: hypothetical protein KDL87_16985, partial [Verrucomicrobiae bacterium]|nr:hypothetical protein [Verrucomicrobiae bacterium]
MNSLSRFFLVVLAAGIPAAFSLVPATGRAADEKGKDPKAKPKPIKLAVAKIAPEISPVPEADPGFDFDPNVPSYLRPVRLFNRDGRFLDAQLLSITGNVVTVKRLSDEKQFEVSLENLDEVSTRRVELWMERDPNAIDFSIDITAKKRQAESDSFETLGRVLKTSRWVYDVVITNQSRNELRDAEVEYRIIYDDEVEFVKSSVYPGKGENQQDGQAVPLPPMAFNGRAEFSTPAVDMHTYEYVPLRGEKEYFRDQIVGIWVRVSRQGKVIAEFQSNAASMHNLAWDGEDEIDIVVKDS